jgi:hypothetical protein
MMATKRMKIEKRNVRNRMWIIGGTIMPLKIDGRKMLSNLLANHRTFSSILWWDLIIRRRQGWKLKE